MVVVVLIQSIFCVAYIMVFRTLACLYFTLLYFALKHFVTAKRSLYIAMKSVSEVFVVLLLLSLLFTAHPIHIQLNHSAKRT